LAKILLAHKRTVCSIAEIIVQLGRILSSFKRVPTSALGGLLAVLLLVATTFSVSHSLHQLLHHDSARTNHLCLACSFAKGQVSVAVVALFVAAVAFCCLWRVCTVGVSPSFGPDYRLSPSRAPPRL
jgi:hypothetical protein